MGRGLEAILSVSSAPTETNESEQDLRELAVEQISPELVLVCPELREWALGALC